MNVLFLQHHPCPMCGYRNVGILSTSVRVNKRSLRTTGGGLGMDPRRCRECGFPMGSPVGRRMVLDAKDAAKVAAARARRWAA